METKDLYFSPLTPAQTLTPCPAMSPPSSGFQSQTSDTLDPLVGNLGQSGMAMVKAILTYDNGKEFMTNALQEFFTTHAHLAPAAVPSVSAKEVREAQRRCLNNVKAVVNVCTHGTSDIQRRYMLSPIAAFVHRAARNEVQKIPPKKLSITAFEVMKWLLDTVVDEELEAFYNAQIVLRQQRDLKWSRGSPTAAGSSANVPTASSSTDTLPSVTESHMSDQGSVTGSSEISRGEVTSNAGKAPGTMPDLQIFDEQSGLASTIRTSETSASKKYATARAASIYPKPSTLEDAVRQAIERKGFPDLS